MQGPAAWTRRTLANGCIALAGVLVCMALPAQTQQAAVAFPAYRGEHALQGLYGIHMSPQLRAFEVEAQGLTATSRQHCAGSLDSTEVLRAWSKARLAWMIVSNPALGPVVTRRTQREIDFWPVRPALLQRALDSAPKSLEQMERVGGPAKGFPTMEVLLRSAGSEAHCPYLVLIAEGIEAESRALREDFADLARRDWSADEASARTAFSEWINQWLGGLERLRWQQIEQPIQRALTAGSNQTPAFARQQLEDNRADWLAQWQSLRVLARLDPEPGLQPPQPGQALIPIEALLLGKGHIALAERWGKAIDAVTEGMTALPTRPGDQELMALSAAMKAVSSLYQGEVAAALDVPLGFSSADGD